MASLQPQVPQKLPGHHKRHPRTRPYHLEGDLLSRQVILGLLLLATRDSRQLQPTARVHQILRVTLQVRHPTDPKALLQRARIRRQIHPLRYHRRVQRQRDLRQKALPSLQGPVQELRHSRHLQRPVHPSGAASHRQGAINAREQPQTGSGASRRSDQRLQVLATN